MVESTALEMRTAQFSSNVNLPDEKSALGRRRLGKNLLTLLQHWSGAVMCPACLCGG